MSDTDPRSLREELEIRVVALLTGEISEADADELEKILSVDVELAAYRDRMAELIGDLHTAREEISPKHPDMRLSDGRREELLGSFATVEPNEIQQETERKVDWKRRLLGLAALLTVSFIIFSMSIPAFQKVRSSAPREYAMSESNFEVPSDEVQDANEMFGDIPATGRLFRSDNQSMVSDSTETVTYFGLQTAIPEELIEGTPQPVVVNKPARVASEKEMRSLHFKSDNYASYSGVAGSTVAVDEAEFEEHLDVAPASGGTVMRLSGFRDNVGSNASGPVDPFAAPASSSRSNRAEEEALQQIAGKITTKGVSSGIVNDDFLSLEGRDSDALVSSYAVDQVEVDWAWAAAPQGQTEPSSRSRYANANATADRKSGEVEAKSLEVAQMDYDSEDFGWSSESDELRRGSSAVMGRFSQGADVRPAAPAPVPVQVASGSMNGAFGGGGVQMGESLGWDDGADGVELWGGRSTDKKQNKDASNSALATVSETQATADAYAPPSSPSTYASYSSSVDPIAAGTARENAPADFFAAPGNAAKKAPAKAKSAAVLGYKTRENILEEVDTSWGRPEVFDVEPEMQSRVMASPAYHRPTTEQRMKQIVIPQVNFRGLPLSRVVETLSELSLEYDSERRGIAMEYKPVDGHDPKVNISLRNLSLNRILEFVTEQVDYSYDVSNDQIVVQSRSDTVEEQTAIARSKNVRQTPKAEKQTRDAPTSTFSLNVSDVSFKMAQAALSNSRVPVQSAIRTEEFVNSFDYGDPAPRGDEPVAFNWEIAKHPYAHGRHIVRFSLETQAAGRSASQPLNINLLVDNSGSMQRPDRRAILEKSLESLGEKLTEQDQLNVILFARQPKLIANASTVASQQIAIHDTLAYKPEGGTNLEAALDAAYANAHANYNPQASNRLILMTDGAANLGDVDPSALAAKVIAQRKQGIALDAYGIGWEDYNDALLEEITRNGDGRYAFLNSVEDASKDFSEKLAGSLRVAAADVKVQIIWNTERVTAYRQVGYDLHQLKKEDFRDNTVDAAEIGEAEAGTALYVLKINEDPDLVEPLGTLSVRYRVPATGKYLERSWPLNMPRSIPGLESASPALKLAASSAFFAERLAENPYARDYSLSDLSALTADLPEAFPTQPRVVELQNMINSARILLGDTK
ncbi:MAG: von Willebrand factor type A domain-containing protein [Opitutales bacterium]|jgi:Mg-chelatase subunit ChlD|nr:von Willebrand factor type A domain-containing protein [Opitutales bacterium]MDP4776971.1 von Willebrand factor type A domain-containing protein [Opitutales bacterium]MDP4884401.1 von Willebrand factor type A domain-containing protein [Opitutales bacterium]MDP5079430.1 von Willebrand factor type A domain-containing protein [Opitutales bacterium]